MKVEEIIDEEIYSQQYGRYYFIGRTVVEDGKPYFLSYIDNSNHVKLFYKDKTETDIKAFKIANNEEKRHFLACEKAGKYIECPKTDVLQEIEIY